MNILLADDDKDRQYKIVFMGDGGVGKSCCVFRIMHDAYVEKYDPTIEDNYEKDDFKVDGSYVRLEILDTRFNNQV